MVASICRQCLGTDPMYGTVALLAMAALGFKVGWQPLPDGGVEYIIQIEPHMLETLKGGQEIASDIPPSVRGVRSYRITVGTGDPPRELPPQPPQETTPEVPAGPVVDPFALPAGSPRGSPTPGESDRMVSSESPSDFSPQGVPRTLPANSGGKPLKEQPANYLEQSVTGQNADGLPPAAADTAPNDDPPWMPLTLAVAGMFGSMGGMLYLGWIAWDYRRRYRGLLERLIEAGGGRMKLVDGPDAGNR